jgi:hypothetical protein
MIYIYMMFVVCCNVIVMLFYCICFTCFLLLVCLFVCFGMKVSPMGDAGAYTVVEARSM